MVKVNSNVYLVIALICLTTQCHFNLPIFKADNIEVKGGYSEVILYSDSTFTEKRVINNKRQKYHGHWKFDNVADSTFITTTERSGTEIYTLTSKQWYRLDHGRIKEQTATKKLILPLQSH